MTHWLAWVVVLEVALVDDVRLDAVPVSCAYVLSKPASFACDNDQFLVLDLNERVVFRWRRDGTFSRAIGSPGKGPGELDLETHGGRLGYVFTRDLEITVYDAGKRALIFFDRNGQFVREMPFVLTAGSIESMFLAHNGDFVVVFKRFVTQNPTYELVQVEAGSGEIQILASEPDQTFDRISDGGEVTGFNLFAYAPKMTAAYDWQNDVVFYGNGSRPLVKSLAIGDAVLSTLKLPLLQVEVTVHHRREFSEQKWLRNMPFNVIYPDKKPFFNRLLVTEEWVFGFTQSPVTNDISGCAIRRRDKLKQRFEYACGEDGSLLAAGNQILSITTDDQGSFALRTVQPAIHP